MKNQNQSTNKSLDEKDPEKWKVRVVFITLILGLITFGGVVLIPTINPLGLQSAIRIGFGVVVIIAIVLVALFLFRTILSLEREAIQRSSTQIAEQILQGAFTYRFDPNDGGLYYENVRNVAIRVRTLQEIMKSLMVNLQKYTKGQLPRDILVETGRIVGVSFAEDFAAQVLPKRNIRNDRVSDEMLKLWREYDFVSGFAKFDFDEFDPITVGGKIKIDGHALNRHRMNEKPILCPFFHGYVEAIISHYSEHEIKLTSSCSKGPHRVCELTIEPAQEHVILRKQRR